MDAVRFEWDPTKAALNQRKHGISFREAQSVFADESALFLADPDHSADEERFLLLGLSGRFRILLVVHTVDDDGDTVRIVSARRATRREQRQYLERMM